MLQRILYISLCLFVASCGVSKKKSTHSQSRSVTVNASDKRPQVSVEGTPTNKAKTIRTVERKSISKADEIINTALTFSGTRYKFGGTSKKGMDCSGLLYVAFGEHDVSLPRVSYHMAEEGKRINVRNVEKGDLLFFKTSRKSKRINHVGMVVATGNEVKFIHASSSRGVIVSSLREGYWNSAFVKANRIL
ncbi:C40 family peptidase [Aurantibacter crassamenti]|uniref:C40 family peptidase n=1 Tax=Aurantibacter crassamenti TaxID=1837375 RepID=UPI00193A55E3|nr:C40 family peptidase [Aurantibacter crassamenti]MBM1104687.1 C40 family peptidase [Aurantibacter crassamenti]